MRISQKDQKSWMEGSLPLYEAKCDIIYGQPLTDLLQSIPNLTDLRGWQKRFTPEKNVPKKAHNTHMNQSEKWHLQGINFPGSRMLFPGKREGQKSGISREFPSREFPGANTSSGIDTFKKFSLSKSSCLKKWFKIQPSTLAVQQFSKFL